MEFNISIWMHIMLNSKEELNVTLFNRTFTKSQYVSCIMQVMIVQGGGVICFV